MRVLTLATQKGGSGKTTIASCLAVAAAQDGEYVVALDTDPQGTLAAWGRRRQENDHLGIYAVDPSDLSVVLSNAARNGATLAVVDTAGAHGPNLALSVRGADYCLIPVRPTLFDVEATRPVVKLLRSIKGRFGFVLSQVNTGSAARNLDAAAALVSESAESPPMVAHRNDFQDAAAAGLGVTEFAPRGKAAAEIRYLWSLLRAQLGEVR